MQSPLSFKECYILIKYREIDEILRKTYIEEIWGIGRNTTALFHKYGIYKCSEITKQNEFWLKKIWGKRGLELKMELSGISAYPVNSKMELPKSIQKTSAFSHFTNDKEYKSAEFPRFSQNSRSVAKGMKFGAVRGGT